MLASSLTDISALVAAIAVLVTAIATPIVAVLLAKIHKEVKTANGITIGQYADRTEGRRIEAEVPVEDRTHKENLEVERLTASEAEHADPPLTE